MRLLRETFGEHRQGYDITRYWQHRRHLLRVRLHFDQEYEFQSWANVEVLADDRTWTALAPIPADDWHHRARPLFRGRGPNFGDQAIHSLDTVLADAAAAAVLLLDAFDAPEDGDDDR